MVHALNAAAAATDDDEVSARAADAADEHARRPLSDRVGWLAVIWRPVFDAHCRCPCLSCVRRARVYIITLTIIICAPHHHRCRPIATNNHSNYFGDNKTVPILVIRRRRRVSALRPAPLGPERSRTTGSSATDSRQ